VCVARVKSSRFPSPAKLTLRGLGSINGPRRRCSNRGAAQSQHDVLERFAAHFEVRVLVE